MMLTCSLCLRDIVEARLIFPRFPTEFVYLTMDVADSDVSQPLSIGGSEVVDSRDKTSSLYSRGAGSSSTRRWTAVGLCLCTVTVSWTEPLICGRKDGPLVPLPPLRDSFPLTLGGISTAPAIVMGYLMYKFGWEYTTALAYVQSKRYCVSPASVSVGRPVLLHPLPPSYPSADRSIRADLPIARLPCFAPITPIPAAMRTAAAMAALPVLANLQFEIQLREYAAIAQAHKALPRAMRVNNGDHKRQHEEDSEGYVSPNTVARG